MTELGSLLYDDGRIQCYENALVIRHYFITGQSKVVAWSHIRSVTTRRIKGSMRIWGTGDFRHWFNLDWSRPRKPTAFILNVGHWTRPVITPDDVDAVAAILEKHTMGGAAGQVPARQPMSHRIISAAVLGGLVGLLVLSLLDGLFAFSLTKAALGLAAGTAAGVVQFRATTEPTSSGGRGPS